MKTKRVWLIGIALLGLFVLNEYHSRRGRDEALRDEIAKLRERQERLATEVARSAVVVRTQVGTAGRPAMAESSPVAPAAPVASSDTDANDPATRDRRWEEAARASRASVEEAFAAESINSAWATSTRLALQDRLTALARPLSSSLRDIDCRSSICRVEVVHRDTDAWRQFAEKAFTDPQDQAWDGQVFIPPSQPAPDGSLAVVMYLGSKGASLLKRE